MTAVTVHSNGVARDGHASRGGARPGGADGRGRGRRPGRAPGCHRGRQQLPSRRRGRGAVLRRAGLDGPGRCGRRHRRVHCPRPAAGPGGDAHVVAAARALGAGGHDDLSERGWRARSGRRRRPWRVARPVGHRGRGRLARGPPPCRAHGPAGVSGWTGCAGRGGSWRPASTLRLWRRMVLWETRSYSEALRRERDRQLACTDLQDRWGRWAWRWRAPRRARVLYRLGELAPAGALTSADRRRRPSAYVQAGEARQPRRSPSRRKPTSSDDRRRGPGRHRAGRGGRAGRDGWR